MDAEKEISAVIDKVLQRDWKKNPKGDKKNIQQSSTELYGQDICNKLLGMNIPADPMDDLRDGAIKRLTKELSDKKDSLIREAINFVIGEEWQDEDIGYRGTFGIFPDGREVFSFDGRELLEFHGISCENNHMSFKVEASLLYKKLY
jgi:hypothetical protein